MPGAPAGSEASLPQRLSLLAGAMALIPGECFLQADERRKVNSGSYGEIGSVNNCCSTTGQAWPGLLAIRAAAPEMHRRQGCSHSGSCLSRPHFGTRPLLVRAHAAANRNTHSAPPQRQTVSLPTHGCGPPPALLSAMARPRSAIDQHRDYVSRLYLSGVSRSRICYKLRKHFHVAVNLSTLSRRIADWDLPRQQTRTRETPELIETVRDLIFRVGLTEKQTISVLQRQGWPITKRGLKRIRLHPDRRWLRRLNSEEERLALLEKAEQAIIEMTQRSNAISGYGKNLLQPYLRQQMQLWVPRDPLFQMYKVMFPNEVELRKRMFRRKKGQFLVPGPNYQWCIDGHDKLKAYGFEIYAAIDAYSRNIIWFYVGHTATTALSVLKQYLAACGAYGLRPWFLQADRGSETPLAAAAHWNFVLRSEGRIEWHGQVFQQGKLLKDSYKQPPVRKMSRLRAGGRECCTSRPGNGSSTLESSRETEISTAICLRTKLPSTPSTRTFCVKNFSISWKPGTYIGYVFRRTGRTSFTASPG